MEWRGRLCDLLAVPAGKLLAHGLDDLPLARDHFQRLGDILAELRQTRAAACRARTRCGDDDALARQVLGERLLRRLLAFERGDVGCLRGRHLGGKVILAGTGFKLFQLQLKLVEQAPAALGMGAEPLAVQLGDLQLEMGNQSLISRDRKSVV